MRHAAKIDHDIFPQQNMYLYDCMYMHMQAETYDRSMYSVLVQARPLEHRRENVKGGHDTTTLSLLVDPYG